MRNPERRCPACGAPLGPYRFCPNCVGPKSDPEATAKYPRGTDRGFEPLYHRLSYRRRLIRGLWMLAFGVPLLSVVARLTGSRYAIVYVPTIAVAMLCEAAYNYVKWKRLEESPRALVGLASPEADPGPTRGDPQRDGDLE